MLEQYNTIINSMAIATIITVTDILIGFIAFFLIVGVLIFYVVSNLLIIEFAVMLILGSCLLARQPLNDENRFDENGNPTSAWRIALLGKRIMMSSLFVAMFAVLFLFLGSCF